MSVVKVFANRIQILFHFLLFSILCFVLIVPAQASSRSDSLKSVNALKDTTQSDSVSLDNAGKIAPHVQFASLSRTPDDLSGSDSTTMNNRAFVEHLHPWLNALDESGQKAPSETKFDPLTVSNSIKSQASMLQECYHKYLKLDPQLQGDVIVKLLVSPTGCVENVDVHESSLRNHEFINEITGLMKEWRNLGVNPHGDYVLYRQTFEFGIQH